MNKGLWIARKNYLLILIKKVSDLYGGDDVLWLDTHASQVLALHPGELIEGAIMCYERIVKTLESDGVVI